jgi:hypothetical protein
MNLLRSGGSRLVSFSLRFRFSPVAHIVLSRRGTTLWIAP